MRNRPHGISRVRVIVTRPAQESVQWVQALALAGFDALALALIEVAAAPDVHPVAAAWERINAYDAVMFVSGNAAAHFFALKPAGARVFIASDAIKTRVFATGPGTVAALLTAGVARACIDAPHAQAGQFDSEALWAVVHHRVKAGYRVLIVRGVDTQRTHARTGPDAQAGVGRDWFASQVLAAGGTVDFVVAYQRQAPVWDVAEKGLAQRSASDGSVWIFTSSQAIENLVAACPDQSWQQAMAVATHPRIAQTAREAGFGVVSESRPTLAALTASIESMQ